jgi:hypothetical protein
LIEFTISCKTLWGESFTPRVVPNEIIINSNFYRNVVMKLKFYMIANLEFNTLKSFGELYIL